MVGLAEVLLHSERALRRKCFSPTVDGLAATDSGEASVELAFPEGSVVPQRRLQVIFGIEPPT